MPVGSGGTLDGYGRSGKLIVEELLVEHIVDAVEVACGSVVCSELFHKIVLSLYLVDSPSAKGDLLVLLLLMMCIYKERRWISSAFLL